LRLDRVQDFLGRTLAESDVREILGNTVAETMSRRRGGRKQSDWRRPSIILGDHSRQSFILGWNRKIEAAFRTPEAIFYFGAGSCGERRAGFAVNPTTGALKASANLGLEAREALLQQSRGMEVRLYLGLARLYVRKLVFQIDRALLGMAPDLCGKLPDLPRVGHCLSPMTGLFRANVMTCFAARTRTSYGARNGAGGLFSKSESSWDQRVRSISPFEAPTPWGVCLGLEPAAAVTKRANAVTIPNALRTQASSPPRISPSLMFRGITGAKL
jgi:hypothetical protein